MKALKLVMMGTKNKRTRASMIARNQLAVMVLFKWEMAWNLLFRPVEKDDLHSNRLRNHPLQRIISNLIQIDPKKRLDLSEVYNIIRLTDEAKVEIGTFCDAGAQLDFGNIDGNITSTNLFSLLDQYTVKTGSDDESLYSFTGLHNAILTGNILN